VLDIEPMGGIGMSDAVGGPLGSRGRDMLPADDPADKPPPLASMFWARKMGCGLGMPLGLQAAGRR